MRRITFNVMNDPISEAKASEAKASDVQRLRQMVEHRDNELAALECTVSALLVTRCISKKELEMARRLAKAGERRANMQPAHSRNFLRHESSAK